MSATCTTCAEGSPRRPRNSTFRTIRGADTRSPHRSWFFPAAALSSRVVAVVHPEITARLNCVMAYSTGPSPDIFRWTKCGLAG
jgi:hypothetical protein